ncbi:hypothetical protein CERSUDRAFT_82747 [Gelatoporia subvermispora B]|uniref:Uncharacterized protein n=1 Tax=Ceriporiopsis subvermispora (strain B) TaxID=914234 RepID=M2RI74_CERS8|nr:hypothetical protein CERSUDRAFT_82747 [Gelatoporia subvermispora B]
MSERPVIYRWLRFESISAREVPVQAGTSPSMYAAMPPIDIQWRTAGRFNTIAELPDPRGYEGPKSEICGICNERVLD